ncbi:methyltransferase [Cucumis melo var. makuwa]|uniref:Methyltransferase n=1 Tax=Cucumis melo var. makuwa TaxID=1194695 RepID=A0A5D3BZV7_CUCMM|nr:methyltransferase [Cucumis melo var. makuwa]
MGVHDVIGVELIDSPPLVSRADPHNLPFFDHVFDLAFTAHLVEALFLSRFVSEMERVVRPNDVQNSLLNNMKCQRKSSSLAGPLLALRRNGSSREINSSSLENNEQILDSGKKIGLEHFKSVKPWGLVMLEAMDKGVMLNRNKVCNIAFFLTA